MTKAQERLAVLIIEAACAEGWPAARIDKAIADQMPSLTEQEIAVCWARAISASAKRQAPDR